MPSLQSRRSSNRPGSGVIIGLLAALFAILLLALVAMMSSPAAHAQSAQGSLDRGAVITGPGLPDLVIQPLDPANGRLLYGRKGCVVCHIVNGIGGIQGSPLAAFRQPVQMDPFDFAAKLWSSAQDMIIEQLEFGGQIELTGTELANIFAFINSVREQNKFSEDDVPDEIRRLYD